MPNFPVKETISSRVLADLRGAILRTELPPGAKINLDHLRDRFATSISPLREALARLTADGLVVFEDQRGFRVAPVSREEFADLALLRADLEVAALRASVEKGDVNWESEVVRALHRLARTPTEGPEDGWQQAHSVFHKALIAGAGRPVLQAIWGGLADRMRRYRALVGLWGDGLPLHEEMAAAAIRRDAQSAIALLRDDLERERSLVWQQIADLNTGLG